MADTPEPGDPTSYVPPGLLTPADGRKWAERHWLNVPGPFYTGQTDNCWCGRLHAPRHVMYGGDFYNEFVFRQPRTRAEVECLVTAAEQDPFDGYACDGDLRWTPEAVGDWWDDRHRVEEHMTGLLREWTTSTEPQEIDAAAGARDFLAYLAGDLRTDLRAYVFRLREGRCPDAGDRLPEL